MRHWFIWLDEHDAMGSAIALGVMVLLFIIAWIIRVRQDRRRL